MHLTSQQEATLLPKDKKSLHERHHIILRVLGMRSLDRAS
jgi:hypothetical protein